jgi:hypothetical protein
MGCWRERREAIIQYMLSPLLGVYQILPVPTDFALDRLTKRSVLFSKLTTGLNIFIQMLRLFYCRRLSIDTLPSVIPSNFSEKFALETVYGVKRWTVRAVLWSYLWLWNSLCMMKRWHKVRHEVNFRIVGIHLKFWRLWSHIEPDYVLTKRCRSFPSVHTKPRIYIWIRSSEGRGSRFFRNIL